MAKYTIGVSSITVGAIAGDGGPGTTLAALGLTMEDSCKLTQDDPTTTEFFAEEQDAAVFTKSKGGAIKLTFQVMDPDTDTLVALFGGSAPGTTPNKTWNMPATIPTIEKTVKVTPSEGMTVMIPRGSIVAKLNGDFSKKALFVIDVTVTALTPTKSGVGPIQFIE